MTTHPHAPKLPHGLYLLTPDEPDTAKLLARTRAALSADGVRLLQYRNKLADAGLAREQASALLALCREHRVPLIINDDVQLAAHIGADGVHLGETDGEIAAARELLGRDAIIGASCYDDLDRARRAHAQGASYIAFGAFFPSSTKPNARRAPPELLTAAEALNLPRVAIGGITPDNGGRLTAAGADLLAVISSVYDTPDPAAAVRAFRSCFE